jgi:hypothetical protein
MPGHYGHVLEMAFSPFIADRTIMGVVEHQPFDRALSEFDSIGVINGDACALNGGRHACHYDVPLSVLFVLELFDGALPTGPYGMHDRMPTEVWQIKT